VGKVWKAIASGLQQQLAHVLIEDLGAINLGFEHESFLIHHDY